MKLTLVCKGSPEEIASILKAVQSAKNALATNHKSGQRTTRAEEAEFVPVEIMQRALTRRPLTENTRIMLKTLCDAGDAGRYVSRSTLCETTGLTLTQLNGVLGKFGARVMGTHGYDGNSSYLEHGKNEVTGEGSYRLPEALCGVVHQILEGAEQR